MCKVIDKCIKVWTIYRIYAFAKVNFQVECKVFLAHSIPASTVKVAADTGFHTIRSVE